MRDEAAVDTTTTANGCAASIRKTDIHVEVLQSALSSERSSAIENAVRRVLQRKTVIVNNAVFQKYQFSDPYLKANVDKITVQAPRCAVNEEIALTEDILHACQVHVYRTLSDEPTVNEFGPDSSSNSQSDERGNVPAGRHWPLPNTEFEGLWENLIYEENIKEEMFSYAETMLMFAQKNVDPNVVSCNRVLLFHGPPGSGKTTLCKALAQKLCIRFGKNYKRGNFFEVNSHSLFSKWFAESGKLVAKLFAKINDMLEDETALLVVLIDEVESLTVARKQALAGNEPSDAVRVVNALLTQIDYIRRWPNVLILTTSNLAEAVDPAFLDRADIKQFIGPPSPLAIQQIFCDAVRELHRAGVIATSNDPLLSVYFTLHRERQKNSSDASNQLLQLASRCVGFSGRTIRKLPLLAYAYKLGAHKVVSLGDFIDALSYAVQKHLQNEEYASVGGGGDSDSTTSGGDHPPMINSHHSPARNLEP